MSPLHSQPTLVLQSGLTEELISEPFWIDSAISSAFREDTFHLFEGAATALDGPPAFPTDHLLPSFEDDHLGPPSAQSGDGERVNLADFTVNVCDVPFSVQPEDLYAVLSLPAFPPITTTDWSSFDPAYQTAYRELFYNEYSTCMPADISKTCETPSLTPATTFAHDLSISIARLSTSPVDPSTVTVYTSRFGYAPEDSTPDNAFIVSPPPTSPSFSSHSDSSESDDDGDYVPLIDNNDRYCSTQSISHQREKRHEAASKRKYPRRVAFSPSHSTSSGSGEDNALPRRAKRSHPYRRNIPFRNLQCEGTVAFINNGSDFRCPVAGCGHVQGNQRIPDLKRHIDTHNHLVGPKRWTCCGVGVDRAHLHGVDIQQDMAEEDYIRAGAYIFRGRLMIGGCMNTFSRRDALKRHLDNPNVPCVGHLDSYNS